MKQIIFTAIILAFLSCSNQNSKIYKYNPLDGVETEIQLKNYEESPDGHSVVHFEYKIRNINTKPLRLTVNKIQAKINGKKTIDAKYNSLASVPDANFLISSAESQHDLFFIIKTSAISDGIIDFDLTASGLSILN